MADLGTYDENATPDDVFEVIPAGRYTAIIYESDVKPTKENTGDILSLKWGICEGEYEGRTVFDRINLRNNNAQAQEIGQRQLAALRQAIGVGAVRDSSELHNIPCIIIVKVRPAGPDKKGVMRDAKNEVKGYARIGDAPTPVAAAAPKPAPTPLRTSAKPPTPAQPQPVAAAAVGQPIPPWKRGK